MQNSSRVPPSSAKRAVFGTVIAILLLTILEFPPPLGLETRPQADVSVLWLALFLVILVVGIAAVPMVYKRPVAGGMFGMLAAFLNIVQVIADQGHLMQPEVAPLGYSILEAMVVIASLALAYASWSVMRTEGVSRRNNTGVESNA